MRASQHDRYACQRLSQYFLGLIFLFCCLVERAYPQSADAKLSLSPIRVSFGTVGTELTGEKTLKIRNSGKGELRVEVLRWGAADREDFSQRNNCGRALGAGDECAVVLSFSPLAEGLKTTTLEVLTNVGSKTITLAGKAQGPKLLASPRSVRFSSQAVGGVSTAKLITIKNSGKGILRIATITRTGEGSTQFTQSNTCGATLEPKDSCRIAVGFVPSRGGDIKAALTIVSNTSESVIALQGKGFQAEPKLALSPAKLSFRNQGTEVESTEKKVTVRNKGTAPLMINLVRRVGAGAEAFSQRNTCGAPVEPKGSCEIWLTFTPNQAMSYQAQLQLETNSGASGASPLIALSGNGVGPKISVRPTRLRFSSEAVGAAVSPQKVTIQNTGKGLLRVSSVRRLGEGTAAFSQNNNCGRVLVPKASCVVNVSFYPSAVGAFTTSLQLFHNAEPLITEVSLSGESLLSAKSISRAEAFRFLQQGTFGPTTDDMSRLMSMGDSTTAYSRWIDEQIHKPVSLQLPGVIAYVPVPRPQDFGPDRPHKARVDIWFNHALTGEDQLRQRVAWALSQIMVVSDASILLFHSFAAADFYDTLSRHAFGNYRDLLEAVTLHPAMGLYLSMFGNQKAVEGTNIRPDENYARELMQLFSLGLVQLNLDGTPKLDSRGQPVPTYSQREIQGFARVFTGWKAACDSYIPRDRCFEYANLKPWPYEDGFNQAQPMVLHESQHEPGEKQLLDYPGVRLPGGMIPANQGGRKDLQDALDNIFYHPNVGPFVSRQLIQKLVTSNPTPDYIESVARVFNDDGRGVRGNLTAVVRAILLHPEARNAPSGPIAGKLKEPLLRLTQVLRNYGQSPSGTFSTQTFCCPVAGDSPVHIFGQSPGQAPSVFNFFSPFYSPPGEIADAGLVAPEMQLANENLHTQMAWYWYVQTHQRNNFGWLYADRDQYAEQIHYLHIDEEMAIASDTDALLDLIALKLLGSEQGMSPPLRQATREQVNATTYCIPGCDPEVERSSRSGRVADALYMVIMSPEFALQR